MFSIYVAARLQLHTIPGGNVVVLSLQGSGANQPLNLPAPLNSVDNNLTAELCRIQASSLIFGRSSFKSYFTVLSKLRYYRF